MLTKVLVLSTLLSSTICIVAANLIGAWMQPAPRVLAFNPPGCELPCVLNIIPGITTEAQAEAILAAKTTFQFNGDMDYEHQLKGDPSSQPYIGVQYLYPDTPHYVYQIRITNISTSLGQMLGAGYKVHRVIRSSYSMGFDDDLMFLITFGSNDQIIAIVAAARNLDASSDVTDIYVIGGQDQATTFKEIRDQWHGDDEVKWLGLASVLSYQAEPTIVAK